MLPSSQNDRLFIEVSERFRLVALGFQVKPERLAALLCEHFAANPPRQLVIISRMMGKNLPAGEFPEE